ncbi:MAG TPA: uracil-DNA glycosylase family protein [Polyangiaceae bacterium]|nr:uracil-DNA glycosylase family protein [Polyangiaceae bacterium]
MSAELDPLSELRNLTEALRAHAEWQQACGTVALPAAEPSLQLAVGSSQLGPSASAPPIEPVRLERPEPSRERAPSPAPPPKLTADSSRLTTEERQHRLTVLADEVKSCTKCALHIERKQAVFARGNGSSGLCFVGEGPGADEDEQGFPFVGAAGQLLDRMIAAMGIERDDVYVCNIVKCRPPKNRTPEPEEMSACMPYLTEQLSLVEPQVIVALGKTAVQGLFGTAEGITRIRGRWRLYQGRIAVMPTFHPAYLLRNPAAKREVWADLQLVLKHLGRSLPAKG